MVGDRELLYRARRDPEQFVAFYDRHAVDLFAWFRARTASREAAQDLTAETFAQALTSIGRFRGDHDASAAAWLWGIASNLLRRSYRKARAERSACARLGIERQVHGDDDVAAVDARVDALAVGPVLVAAVAALPVEQAATVRLRIIDQQSYQEIAAILGCSVPAARVRVARALRGLAATLSIPAPIPIPISFPPFEETVR